MQFMLNPNPPPLGVLPDIESFFGINDEKSGLLQTGKKTKTYQLIN